jgi:uncharacterized membrane protein
VDASLGFLVACNDKALGWLVIRLLHASAVIPANAGMTNDSWSDEIQQPIISYLCTLALDCPLAKGNRNASRMRNEPPDAALTASHALR